MAPTKKNKDANPTVKAAAQKQTKTKATNAPKRGGTLTLLLKDKVFSQVDEQVSEEYSPGPATKKRKAAPKKNVTTQIASHQEIAPGQGSTGAQKAASLTSIPVELANHSLPGDNLCTSTAFMDDKRHGLAVNEGGLAEGHTRLFLDDGIVRPSDLSLSLDTFYSTSAEDCGNGVTPFSFFENLSKSIPSNIPVEAGGFDFAKFLNSPQQSASAANFPDVMINLDEPGPAIVDTTEGTELPTPISTDGHESSNSASSAIWTTATGSGTESSSTLDTMPPKDTSASFPGIQSDVLPGMEQFVTRMENLVNTAFSKAQQDREIDSHIAALDKRLQELEQKNNKEHHTVVAAVNKLVAHLANKISNLEQAIQHTQYVTRAALVQTQTMQHRLDAMHPMAQRQGIPSAMPGI